ncbi:MgtC/SapB family protein [Ruegeria marina]|uniref:Protein MgtC n=1 Tax=Ruegeria marina TaxID=639004 RepID=A0A1G6UXR9_9RHOB|nr:MgtC/SapB family protein [Ruegeria marina]SDD46033.1 putative Mg2+ transporter-C (MgtC) family protein [Ruegeria marina]
MQDISSDSALEWQIVILRLFGALVLTGLIGIEREVVEKSAGLRTHMLVGIAACLYSLVTLSILEFTAEQGSHIRVDPVRLVEAVTQGVAFLAAGLIIFARGEVRGLTTGAGMWLAGAVGLSCGLGLWILASAATVLALIVIRVLKAFEMAIGTRDPNSKDKSGERN